jgi:hypothetical protein
MASRLRKVGRIQHALQLVVPAGIITLLVAVTAYAYVSKPPKLLPSPKPSHIAGTSPVIPPKVVTKTVTPTAVPPIKVVAVTPPPASPKRKAAMPPVVVPVPSSSVNNLVPTSPPASSSATTPPSAATSPGSGATSGSGSPSGASAPSSQPTVAPAATPVSYASTNWSGYLLSGGNYTTVSGSWVVPLPTGTGKSTSADASWIGIGGVTAGDLIQIGTDNTVTSSGALTSEGFFEILPAASETVPGLTVTSGDNMTAAITETSPNVWLATLRDVTTGQSYSRTTNYTSSHSSAEWIEEDPSYGNGSLVPFDLFGTAAFSQSSAVDGGTAYTLNSGNASSITLVTNAGKPLATPSAIGSDGASFSVTRQIN